MTVVVSGGKATAVGDVKAWPLAGLEQPRTVTSSRSLDLLGLALNMEYAAIYTSQPWVYAVVNKVARNLARLPLRALREDPTTYQRAPLPRTHPLPDLLSRPYPRGSAFSLVEATFGSLMVYGHALWWKYRPRPGMPPAELWPLDWARVSIQAGENSPIDYYTYNAARGRKNLLPDDVVHFSWWSPAGIRGTSPLEPLRTTLALEDAGRRYAVASFANGIRPSGALVSDRSIGDDAKKELRAEIDSLHSTPDNAFRMMLLDGGLTWQAFSHNAQEAQTIEHRKLNQIEVCAAYDMPPTMLQILDHATFSNIDEQHRMLYQDTFGPPIGNFEATIGSQLLWGEPQLAAAVDDLDGELENTLVAFDLDEILRADITRRAAAYAAMRAAGGLTLNDIRRKEGLTPIDHPAANAVLIPLNMAAVGPDGIVEFPRISETAPAGDPSGGIDPGNAAAWQQIVDHLKSTDSTTARELQDLATQVSALGDRDMAASIDALAKALGEREPIVLEPARVDGLAEIAAGMVEVAKAIADKPAPELPAITIPVTIDGRAPTTKRIDFGDGRTATVTEED